MTEKQTNEVKVAVTVKLPGDLVKRIDASADKNRRSRTGEIEVLLAGALNRAED